MSAAANTATDLLATSKKTFETARVGLFFAVECARQSEEGEDARISLAAVAYACDSLKASANAYAALLGQVHRVRR